MRTPGPWRVTDSAIRGMTATIEKPHGSNRLVIAHIDDVDGFEGISSDNARAIASLPQLIEAAAQALRTLREVKGASMSVERLESALRAAGEEV